MSAISEWLQFAPQPEPLPPGRRWHVFISYRSADRAWALRLYDALRERGYSVFLDQFVLAAAAPLASSLNEALAQSATAVMVWSDAYEESAWCRKEYGALEGREGSDPAFRFVVVKLDPTPLPPFAGTRVYVDFSEYRDGPGGSGLLQLLWGLHGKPIPPAAVQRAAVVDEERRKAGVAIRAAREVGDADALLAMSRQEGLCWQESPALVCQAIGALIDLDQPQAALPVIDDAIARFPAALRPRQLKGLALARAGDWRSAQRVLGELYMAGEIDAETLGIYARTWMDRYLASGERRYLLKSRDLNRQAFEASPADTYAGIGAASKSALAGEPELARELAQRVAALVGSVPVPGDYWRTATAAEAQLILGDYGAAAALYRAAVTGAPEEKGSLQSTRQQAVLLLDCLGAEGPQKDAVLAAFG